VELDILDAMLSSNVDEGDSASDSQVCNVSLRFTDGETRDFAVASGTTVLAAAKAAGLRLASQCEIGTCCTCAAVLTCGTAEMGTERLLALTKEEVSGGHRLLCQTVVSTDASFNVEYPSSLLLANPPVNFTAKVSRLTWLAETVVQLDVKIPKALRLKFTAGQYCRIKVPGTEEWRSYSMASGEHEQSKASFLIRVLPTGVMSDFLRGEANPGALLEMEGPLGGFVLEPSVRPHVLIAGGTGLAPMLSMLDRLRLVRPTPPILLAFGCARESELFLLDELEARMAFMPSLQVRVCLEETTAVPGVIRGNPVSVMSASDISEDSIAYLCGPPGMVAAAEATLAGFGLNHESIRSEQFLAS
jgi:ferredoxin-NADP reductase/ferredoxin